MTTILLTSTVNVNLNKSFLFQINKEERVATYLKSIKQWLEKTNLNIVVVENSGYPFEELAEERVTYKDRFEIITFIESELPYASQYFNNRIHICSKGASELLSINHAYNYSKLIKQSIFVVKVTCRYFVPELEEFLSTYDLNNYEALRQSDENYCEIVGCHIRKYHNIFSQACIDGSGYLNAHVETIYNYRINHLCKDVIVCKTFDIEPTQMGGNNVIRTKL
jgi:hypothetical protein